MKSFQNRARGYRSQPNKKTTQDLQSPLSCHKQPLPRKQIPEACEAAHPENSSKYTINPHSEVIKSIIALNQQYFQSKLQNTPAGKSNVLKLKIPSKTGPTIYKKDYLRKSCVHLGAKDSRAPAFDQVKPSSNLFASSTYRQQFTKHPPDEERHKRRDNHMVDTDGPTFHQSQYRHNYLNWGANSYMPSMKPEPRPAVTNLPLQKSTIYSQEFTHKPQATKHLHHSNTISNFSGLTSNIISNNVSTPLLYMTTNHTFFDKKSNSKQNSLKPTKQTLKLGESAFKGKTEYQSSFMGAPMSNNFDSEPKRPLEDLQNMILTL